MTVKFDPILVEKAKQFIDKGAPGWVGFEGPGPATDDDADQLLLAGWRPEKMKVWVVQTASGKVIGVYSSKTAAEKAALSEFEKAAPNAIFMKTTECELI